MVAPRSRLFPLRWEDCDAGRPYLLSVGKVSVDLFERAMPNGTLAERRLVEHPDKTFIGRVERGFDFLGYHLAPGRLTLAQVTVELFLERAPRL